MSLNAIFNSATSGLMAAQTQIRVTSDNVANVNTPGYIRKVAQQTSLITNGIGSGVEVGRVHLATDRFLQAASFGAGADAARQGVRYELYDRIQALFGDPGGDAGLFSQIDGIFSAFASTTEDGVSSARRHDAVTKAQAVFDESARIFSQIQATRQDADARISSAVDRSNVLLEQIEALNGQIAAGRAVDADTAGAENQQSILIDELSGLMDIHTTVRPYGGVAIRTNAGVALAGNGGHATISYARAGSVSAETAFNDIIVTEPGGLPRSLTDGLTSGEIKGLLEIRDVEAPSTAERLGELMTRLADELNRAHNASSAVPAPATLTGRNVGQSLETALAGFTGQTTVAVTDASGVIQSRADIVFAGGSMTINGQAATPGTFLTVLNSQLGGAATASFQDGVLSLSATGTNGVAIADDATSPSNKAGRGFSHYFGLNDLVRSEGPALYDQGLTVGSAHGFTAGETLTLRMTAVGGGRLRDITVAVPPGGTVGDLIAALNNPATGVGRYGSFALDGNGALSFTALGSPAPTLSVLNDRTSQTPSGVSVSELFGIGAGVRSSRADGFSIRSDILQNPAKLALAQLNLSAAAGTSSLSAGDTRGAQLLSQAGENAAAFQTAAGGMATAMTVSGFAADLSGEIGARAATAESKAQAALALRNEASARRSAQEGVNLDEELVALTTYQQAYNASARMIQAAKDMYDTLLGMV